jgi:hypothetical protein
MQRWKAAVECVNECQQSRRDGQNSQSLFDVTSVRSMAHRGRKVRRGVLTLARDLAAVKLLCCEHHRQQARQDRQGDFSLRSDSHSTTTTVAILRHPSPQHRHHIPIGRAIVLVNSTRRIALTTIATIHRVTSDLSKLYSTTIPARALDRASTLSP